MASSSEEEQHDVVIVGGGIVGLATALALHRKGIESLVLEKSNSLRATGSAIGVYINGWHALDQLGVGTELRMKAISILENEALRCLKRSDLVEALANGLPVNSIRFGCQVAAIGTDPLTSFPVVHLDDGTNIKAKVLIGCDGSNSIVAKSLGLESPKLFPMHAVRGFTNFPNGHIYGNTAFRLREDQTVFGRIPVDNKLVYWFVGWRSRPKGKEYSPLSWRNLVAYDVQGQQSLFISMAGVATKLQMKAIPILEMHNALVDQKRMQVTPSRDEEFRCLRRSDLFEALANGVSAKSIRFGCQVVAVGTDPLTSFPVVHLNDGTTIKAKVLIGCDGLNSVVAKSLGLEAPRLFPMHAVRGFTNYPNGHIYGSNAFRIRAHQVIFGRYPVNSKLVYWFIGRQNRRTDSEVATEPRGIQDFSLEILKGFPTDVIEMVRHCDLDSISFTHVRYQAPWNILFANLQRGTMTIAGDAMHAMGPFLGQGGNCGLEDAVVLARCLSRELSTGLGREINDLEFKKRAVIALEDYVKGRRPRVMRLSTQSYLTGSLMAAKSWAKRVLCLVILEAFFGGMSLSHTRYDCGPL